MKNDALLWLYTGGALSSQQIIHQNRFLFFKTVWPGSTFNCTANNKTRKLWSIFLFGELYLTYAPDLFTIVSGGFVLKNCH